MSKKEQINQLNKLLTRNYDSEKGYEKAMDETDSDELSEYFKHNMKKRYQFGHEIKNMIDDLGGKPDKGSSLIADAHRAWLNIRELFAKDDDQVILKECLRGEKYAKDDYEKAVTHSEIKPEHKRTLSDHLKHVKMCIDQIEKMIEEHA